MIERTASPEELLGVLASPNVASREWVYSQYDQLVQSRTVRRPGVDAGVLRLLPGTRGLALSLDGSGRLASLDPRAGGAAAVFEAARNVACAGGRPLAMTNCLNFGNPEKPDVAWQLEQVIEGMAEACEALGVPIVSGNVSLYNETDGSAIYPSPVVGCVGVVPDVSELTTAWSEGDVVAVVGEPELSLAGSEYAALYLDGEGGSLPALDLEREAALVAFLSTVATEVSIAHDVSDGGLAAALAECALSSGLGADIEHTWDALDLFAESGGRAVIACSEDRLERIGDGAPSMRVIGRVGGPAILGQDLAILREAHARGLADSVANS